MSESFDLSIRRARLRRRPDALYDIAVRGGRIEAIVESSESPAAVVVDAAGGLVTEPFVNPHLHLDKVYTLQRLDEEESLRAYHGEGMGSAMKAIEAASRVKEGYSQTGCGECQAGASRGRGHGNTHIPALRRGHQGAFGGRQCVAPVEGEFRAWWSCRWWRFPRTELCASRSGRPVREAVALGADVVGAFRGSSIR